VRIVITLEYKLQMEDTFKVPFLPTEETPSSSTTEDTTIFLKPELPPADVPPLVRHKNLQYNIPQSSSVPPIEYALEVLRNGSIIDNIALSFRPYTVFGRSPDCDIVLEHQTISRYHAIIQYKSEFEHGQSAGLYLYDCGSTHGTFINKKRIEPKVYVRIKIGYIIKFGQSTRLYIVQGDVEAEAETIDTSAGDVPTHEQMKQFHAKRAKKIAAVRARRENAASEDGDDVEMDWGMGPDAEDVPPTATKVVTSHRNEDDDAVVIVRNDEEMKKKVAEDDLKNRLAYKQAKNDQFILKEIMSRVDEPVEENEDGSKKEPYYLKDPKRALTAFFEREGAELSYDVEDHQFGSYRCTIKLPIVDEYGNAIQAECEQKHCKRKEIINQCIVEACRILDEHGVLREGTSASAINTPRVQQIKRQMLEANDFYEEDEDTFYDRTGDLERKRLKRMEWAGHTKNDGQVETFESLCAKLSKLYSEQVELEQKLETAKQLEENAEKNAPKPENDVDELDIYIRQLKQGDKVNSKLKFQWKKRLLEIDNEERQHAKLLKVCKPKDFNLLTWKQQMREEAKVKLTAKSSVISRPIPSSLPPPPPPQIKPQIQTEEMPPPSSSVEPKAQVSESQSAPVKPKPVVRRKIERPPKSSKDQYDDSEHYSEDKFAGWMPPENEQTGDGRTALNEKYGY